MRLKTGISMVVVLLALVGLGGWVSQSRLFQPAPGVPQMAKYVEDSQAIPVDTSLPDRKIEVAASGPYRLYVHSRAGGITVTDSRSRYAWSSIPPGVQGQTDRFACPVGLSYVDASGTVSEEENLLWQGLTVRWNRVPAGVRVTYAATSLQIQITVTYRLTAEGLVASIGQNDVREGADKKLVAVKLLRNFGAQLPTNTKGWLFVPDGVGAVRRIGAHSQSDMEYGGFIYGPDLAIYQQRFRTPYPTGNTNTDSADAQSSTASIEEIEQTIVGRERLTLPVFGIGAGKAGLIGIVEAGEADCQIRLQDDGPTAIEFYRVGPEFYYRKYDQVLMQQAKLKVANSTMSDWGHKRNPGLGARVIVTSADPRPILGERRILYHFTAADVTWQAMARYYRDYLRQRGQLAHEAMTQDPGMELSLLCAVDQNHQAGRRVIPMTTFPEARQLVEQVLAKGVDKLTVTLLGWQRGGMYGNMRAGAEPQLGGDQGLHELIDYCHSRKVRVRLDVDYTHAYAGWGGYDYQTDLAFTRTQEPIREDLLVPHAQVVVDDRELSSALRYRTSPLTRVEQAIREEAQQLWAYNADGYVLRGLGRDLWSDLSSQHWVTREQAATAWRRLVDTLRTANKELIVDYSPGYLWGHVDGVDGLALQNSECWVFNQETPFLPLVMGPQVPYTGSAGNLRPAWREQFLHDLAYGARPCYLLSYQGNDRLINSTAPNFWSTDYRLWLDKAVAEWLDVKQRVGEAMAAPLVDYQPAGVGGSITTYANGWRLLVNRTAHPMKILGRSVPALDFVVTKPSSRRVQDVRR